MPLRPFVTAKCQDLVCRLIREKESRLCCHRYKMKNCGLSGPEKSSDFFGGYVFADDGEDIKAHRWFKNVPWDRLHALTPPFVPRIHGPEDTRYFEESSSVEDMTDSEDKVGLSPEKVRNILQDFRPNFQDLAIDLIREPYDTIKLRGLDRRVEVAATITSNEKNILKHFVRMYGHRERKRPRDRILRDEVAKEIAMDVRKKTAFIGYTWRRMRPESYLGVV
ncbi:hypothetical protein ACO1O0_000537 [Amphichorda felina]